jgi:hypothetical protein
MAQPLGDGIPQMRILSRISCTTVYLADDARAKLYTLVNDKPNAALKDSQRADRPLLLQTLPLDRCKIYLKTTRR